MGERKREEGENERKGGRGERKREREDICIMLAMVRLVFITQLFRIFYKIEIFQMKSWRVEMTLFSKKLFSSKKAGIMARSDPGL